MIVNYKGFTYLDVLFTSKVDYELSIKLGLRLQMANTDLISREEETRMVRGRSDLRPLVVELSNLF